MYILYILVTGTQMKTKRSFERKLKRRGFSEKTIQNSGNGMISQRRKGLPAPNQENQSF
jgi:hypothetical protein